jgi:predicted DNA-binding transcriptional regulator AlpA
MTTPELTARIPIGQQVLAPIIEVFRQVVEQTVKREVTTLVTALKAFREIPPPTAAAATTGVILSEEAKLKAADLRIALLMRKIPDSSGLLVDAKTTAKLLNISRAHLYNLLSINAIPAPVHIGKTIRWRLAEILKWVEEGCPPCDRWVYPKPPKGRR